MKLTIEIALDDSEAMKTPTDAAGAIRRAFAGLGEFIVETAGLVFDTRGKTVGHWRVDPRG